MITTNRIDYKKELEEVIYMFSSGEDLNIIHNEYVDGNTFLDTYNFNGIEKSFTNTYDFKNELERRRYEKRFSKLALYSLLSDYYKVRLPWGALTGIRPTKMARDLGENFEQGFKEIFDVSKKKIDLVKKILDVQEKVIDKEGKYADFFVGIPFCPSRCVYCSFFSQETGKSKNLNEYVDALCKEITASIELCKIPRSIYIGGGTPISLDYDSLKKILESVKPIVKDGIEFTIEAGRPDVITEDKLQLFKDYGVTRLCVNPQSFHDKTLALIGRKHTCQDILDKYELVKKYGFSINMDLIAGLPEETFEDFKYTLDKTISLNPDNITVHTLSLKKGSLLKEKTARLLDTTIYDMIDYSHNTLQENGYIPYYLYRQKYMAGNLENTGYTKPGKECIYNIDVMEEFSDNVACGADSVSKTVLLSQNRIERYGNPKDIQTYINKIDEIIKSKKELYLVK